MLPIFDEQIMAGSACALRMGTKVDGQHCYDYGLLGSKVVRDVRTVRDWRFPGTMWRKRCRLLAREFRAGAPTDKGFLPQPRQRTLWIFFVLFPGSRSCSAT